MVTRHKQQEVTAASLDAELCQVFFYAFMFVRMLCQICQDSYVKIVHMYLSMCRCL